MTRPAIGSPNWGADLNADLDQIESRVGTVETRLRGNFTTAGRPSASVAGAGAMYYDTTLGKPAWSNGTVWKDAAGTTV